MAETQLRTLRVSMEGDSGSYVAAMAGKVAADKAGAASSAAVGAAVTQTDAKIGSAVDKVERLKRQFVTGYAAAVDFERGLATVGRGLDAGKLSIDQATVAVENLSRKYGQTATAITPVVAANASLSAAVATANTRISAQTVVVEEAAREAEMYAQKAAALRASLDPVAASQSRLNAELAEYALLANRAEISTQELAQAETMAKARHDQFVASMNKTPGTMSENGSQSRRQNLTYQAFDVGQTLALGLSPGQVLLQQGPQILQLYAGQGGVKEALKDVWSLAGGIASALGPVGLAFGAAGIAATAFYFVTKKETKTTDEVLKAHQESIKRIRDLWGEAATKRSDYGKESSTSASFGLDTSITSLMDKLKEATKPGIISSSPIGTAITGSIDKYLGDTGLSAKEFRGTTLFKKLQTDFGAFYKDTANGKDTILGFVQELEAIGKRSDNAGIKSIVAGAVEALQPFKELASAMREARIERDRLFDTVGPNGMLLSQGTTNQGDMGSLDAYRQAQKVEIDRAKAQADAQRLGLFAKSPDEKAAAARAAASAQYNDSESPAIRSQRIELAGTQALTAAQYQLGEAQKDRVRQQQASLDLAEFEASISGKTIAEQNSLRTAYQATAQIKMAAAQAGIEVDKQEIALAQQKAAAIAAYQQTAAANKALQSQNDSIEQLQLEASLIGATTQERATATAALQAEQQLRQQGIDLLSREGQAYRDNAVAMASARLEIERQQAAFNATQQAGATMIDQLTVGTGSLKDRLKSMAETALTTFQQLAVANPLKNMLLGQNNPTLGDLFSGRPAIPGATTTGMMTVTATTVMVNGGVAGGLIPGANPGLGGVLGLNPANTNASMSAYQQAISKIESGSYAGNYSALGPLTSSGDRAYGRYQVMGNNVPSWSEQHYGTRLTPEQFQANPAAQDAVFNGQFGGYVSQYGPTGAANKWLTGSATPTGRADINGTTDSVYTQKFNANLAELSKTTATTTQNLGGLGTTTQDLTGTLGGFLGGTKLPAGAPAGLSPSFFPAAPTMGAGYFPPAPTAPGGGILSSLFGWIPKLFGFADGTEFSPGGFAMVGERGPELVNLPRGSQVVPNHRVSHAANQNGGGGKMHHTYNIVVSGNGDKELMARMERAAGEAVRAGITSYDQNALPGRFRQIQSDEYATG